MRRLMVQTVTFVLLLTACMGSEHINEQPPEDGSLGGACLTGNLCNDGLICIVSVCAEVTPTDSHSTDLSNPQPKDLITPDTGSVDTAPAADMAHSDPQTAPADKAGPVEDTGQDIPATEDTSACDPGEGCFGQSCEDNGDCISGLCILHMGGTVCSQLCVDECPQGWSCRTVETGSSDSLFACVSNASHLCLPCISNADCSSSDAQNVCVDYGSAGKFCGASCEASSDCPADYVCEEVQNAQGGLTMQCVHSEGTCSCSDYAVEMGLVTDCAVTNQFGTCNGVRACSAEGLQDCDAAQPVAEICNGLDDDCDAALDEGDLCDDGNTCTADSCAEAVCVFSVTEGATCDDGATNTKDDLCDAAGLCAGATFECPVDDCIQTSTPNGSDCDIDYKALGASCDDDEPMTENDVCDGSGLCAGTPYSCEPSQCVDAASPNGAGCDYVYTSAGTLCDDNNNDTKDDACDGAGTCGGTTFSCNLEVVSDCTPSFSTNGSGCDPNHAAAGTSCDDGSNGTKDDTCDGTGSCEGIAYDCSAESTSVCTPSYSTDGSGCAPNYAAPGTGCEDSNNDTKNDACDGSGLCGGTAYDCSAEVTSVCTPTYTTDGVGCVPNHESVGVSCDDGSNDTKDDTCDGAGVCAGTTYDCNLEVVSICTPSYSTDGSSCVANYAPAGSSCDDGSNDTKDDSCDGTGGCAGTAYDCSAEVTSVCTPSYTTNGSDCSPNHVPTGTSCDDGVACTLNDNCNAGVCAGTLSTACTPGETGLEACGQCGTRSRTCADNCTWATFGACVGEGVCSPGATESENQTLSCGQCGEQQQQRTRTCSTSCSWGEFGAFNDVGGCNNQGVCSPGATETDTQTASCGLCGEQQQQRSRSCSTSCSWNPYSAFSNVGECNNQGICSPGATETESQTTSCGLCGQQQQQRSRSCSTSCNWDPFSGFSNVGGCNNQGACSPGATETDTQTVSCGLCGQQQQQRSRSCATSCNWNPFSGFSNVGGCNNQGSCSPGQTQSQGCGVCGGSQSRSCNGSCQWGGFGACNDPCPSLQTLYRFHFTNGDATNENHFFQHSPSPPGGYFPEGGAFELYAGPAPGLVPLYQVYFASVFDHMLTTNPGEGPGPVLLGYCSASPGPLGSKALKRYFKAETSNHLSTKDPVEQPTLAGLGYAFEGTQCYVP